MGYLVSVFYRNASTQHRNETRILRDFALEVEVRVLARCVRRADQLARLTDPVVISLVGFLLALPVFFLAFERFVFLLHPRIFAVLFNAHAHALRFRIVEHAIERRIALKSRTQLTHIAVRHAIMAHQCVDNGLRIGDFLVFGLLFAKSAVDDALRLRSVHVLVFAVYEVKELLFQVFPAFFRSPGVALLHLRALALRLARRGPRIVRCLLLAEHDVGVFARFALPGGRRACIRGLALCARASLSAARCTGSGPRSGSAAIKETQDHAKRSFEVHGIPPACQIADIRPSV